MFRYLFILIFSLVSLTASSDTEGKALLCAPKHTMENLGLSLVNPGERTEELLAVDFELRSIAVNALLAIYQSMNRNVQENNLIPYRSEYRIPGICWQPVALIPVFDCELTNALDEIRNANEPYLIDCTAAANIALYALFEALLPDLKENFISSEKLKIFVAKQKEVVSEQYAAKALLMTLFVNSLVVKGSENVNPGDYVYIWGHPDYLERHPLGMSRAENLFFVGYNAAGFKMYIGYGVLFKNGPKMEEEIQEYLTVKYLIGQQSDPNSFSVAYKQIREEPPYSARLNISGIQEQRVLSRRKSSPLEY
jgi:hypothetical protein